MSSAVQKSVPISKEEALQLIQLIKGEPVITTRATNASNNILKDEAWSRLTEKFNSIINSCPRRKETLRLKWENMKKAARKRSAQIRMNRLKTRGGAPDVIPPDEALEQVCDILGATCNGYPATFGGDAEPLENAMIFEVVQEKQCSDTDLAEMKHEPAPAAEPLSVPCYTPEAIKSKTMLFPSSKKRVSGIRKIQDEDTAARISRNIAISYYYKRKSEMLDTNQEKQKLELEKYRLENEKLKIQIENLLLENKKLKLEVSSQSET